MRIAVMLSNPPRLFASTISDSTTSGGSCCARRISSSSGSSSMPVSPSDAIAHLGVVDARQVAQFPGHNAYGHFARHFTGRVTTHAVGDDEHAAVGDHEVVVLIARADDADIRTAGAGELDRGRHPLRRF